MRAMLALALLLPPLLTACDDDSEAEGGGAPEPEAPPADPAPDPAATRQLMAEHFQKATEARQAIVGDDIDGARAAMQWLAENDTALEALPEDMRPRLAEMREKAGSFAEATTLTEAGESLARMLRTCGECHSGEGRGPSFETPPRPEGDTLPVQMQRHLWAAERMWEGLVTHEDTLFSAGGATLSDVTLHAEELPQGVLEPERIEALVDHVHGLGADAGEASDWDARAQIYGRLIATCATCHRALGVTAFARAGMQDPNTPTKQP